MRYRLTRPDGSRRYSNYISDLEEEIPGRTYIESEVDDFVRAYWYWAGANRVEWSIVDAEIADDN